MTKVYSLNHWRPLVSGLIALDPAFGRIDLGFAMQWLSEESGGNPCAIGKPGQLGVRTVQNAAGKSVEVPANTFPREIGLGQLYNTDDFTALGLDVAAFRSYCALDGSAGITRELTPDEETAQVRGLLSKIALGMASADDAVAKFKLAWSRVDYFRLVKAPHALPLILSLGMPAVVAKLQRPPRDWAEFRHELGMDHDPQWRAALNACEATAAAVGTQGPSGGGGFSPSSGGGSSGGGILAIALLWLLSKLL